VKWAVSVIMISSMHDNAAIDEATGDDKKPVIITDYNDTKCGVDILTKCVDNMMFRGTQNYGH
jgi:hypothetical protein